MNVIKTPIDGLLIIEPTVFKDKRGYFFESYNKKLYEANGIEDDFVQDNQSFSSFGVIRGLHYQLNPYAQSKLVRVLRGKIFDVAVDLRKDSKTFGQWFGVELSEENFRQFYIPRGFAHGFSVLSETAIVFYKCDNFYAPDYERGIIYNDKKLNIDWRIPFGKEIISEKDKKNMPFEKAEMDF
jgi:dTDP-4-dehydrorhamnose 3,5-epimerase